MKQSLLDKLRAVQWVANKRTLLSPVAVEKPSLMEIYKLIECGQFEEIIKIINAETKSPYHLKSLGLAYLGIGHLDKAEFYFDKAVLSFHRELAGAYLNAANAYKIAKKYETAIQKAQKSIDLAPNWYAGYLMLIAIYENRDADGDQMAIDTILDQISSDHPEFIQDEDFIGYLSEDIDYSKLRQRDVFKRLVSTTNIATL